MDVWMIFSTLALTLGASWCAGINLYATVAVLGLMDRFSATFNLPGDMAVLANPWVIGIACGLYCIEFVADKVPAIDTAWDTVHTFIRVPAGAALAAMALGDVPLEVQVIAALMGGTLALGSHATKATARIVAHGTGTSPILSPVLSVVEDVAVIGTISLVASHPILALFILALMVIGAYYLMKMFWSVARKVFRALFGKRRKLEAMPDTAQIA